jgi:multiple sugar transport system permease protein
MSAVAPSPQAAAGGSPPPAARRVDFRVVALHAALVVGAALTLLPLLWMLSASLMPAGEAAAFPPRLFPSEVTLDHYRDLFTRLDLARYAFNSALLATTVTGLSLLLNSMAGYAFAKLRFRGRDRVFRALLAALVVPAQVAMLPLFLLLRELGVVNTYWGVILPGLASVFGIFLVRQFALAIPDELLDAARVDGASEWWIYGRVVLPLLKPILVTLALFTFMGVWNDFMWPLIVLTDQDLHTLPVALANLLGEHAQDTELMMAGSVLTVLPVLVLFLALQRHYIEGIMLGSVKG